MYATLGDAERHIEDYYLSTDSLRAAWEALSEDDQQVLLNRAEKLIDQLPLRGRSLEEGKAFPREPMQDISLERAKIATIELAIQSQSNEVRERFNLQSQGVKSYSIGDLSENFGNAHNAGLNMLAFTVAFPYLQEWLSGGYHIRPGRR